MGNQFNNILLKTFFVQFLLLFGGIFICGKLLADQISVGISTLLFRRFRC